MKFTVSHQREEDFDQGLRPYSAYRDLGLAPATGGMVQAHVIRFIPPFRPEEVSIPHLHDVDFQMIYVLKGWFKSEFEGEGAHTFHAGSAGSSRRASSTPCSAIPTIANCSRSCCRRISKPKRWPEQVSAPAPNWPRRRVFMPAQERSGAAKLQLTGERRVLFRLRSFRSGFGRSRSCRTSARPRPGDPSPPSRRECFRPRP